MSLGRSQELRPSRTGVVDAVFFTYSALAAAWLAVLLLRDGARPGWPSLLLVVFWVFFSYLLLPRLHRILTRVYVPGYFIGRARTSDGLLGDPVNLGFLGDELQLHATLRAAGWNRADDLGVRTGARIVASTLRRRSYRTAPVSPLLLFDRQQDFAYQQEIADSPSRRHHVRFWQCPEDWLLPGGHRVDWVAAGSYDRRVGLSLFTLQVTHKIDENTDVERDFVVDSVTTSSPEVAVEVIRNFSSGYHSRNGGGDRIRTDGDLPILDLRDARRASSDGSDPIDSRARRPAQTVFGAGVGIVRATTYVVMALLLVVSPDFVAWYTSDAEAALTRDEERVLLVGLGAVLAIAAIVDVVLVVSVLRGRNWSRIWLMALSVVSTTIAFLGSVRGTRTVNVADLPVIAGSILVLLALSSHRARDFAQRRSPRATTTPPSSAVGPGGPTPRPGVHP